MVSTSEKVGLLCSLPYGNLWPRRLVSFSVSIFSSMAKWRKEEERGREEMGREGGTGAEGRDGEEKGREGKGGEGRGAVWTQLTLSGLRQRLCQEEGAK